MNLLRKVENAGRLSLPRRRADAATQIKWGLKYIKGHLRIPVRRLGSRAGHRLVLAPATCTAARRNAMSFAAGAAASRGRLGASAHVSGANVSASSSNVGRIWFHMLAGAVMYSAYDCAPA
jgi:hypothetical protein